MILHFGDLDVEAQTGDTVASALYRAGQRIFSRSFKYHRPRGLLCAAGNCPNCLMNVDGAPNVRTCITPARDGMEVRAQNASPSLELDYLSMVQAFDFLMPVGWYYKVFQKPAVWHMVEPVIRGVAGLGEVDAAQPAEYEHQWLHAATAVIGGGYAGMQAALEAAGRGDPVILVDDQPDLGGQTRYRTIEGDRTPELIGQLRATPNIRVLQGCACFGIYEGNLLGVLQRRPHDGAAERLIHVRARYVVVATGSFETPLIFPNNDLVGVMLSTAVQRLWRLHGIRVGRRAVIVGSEPRAGEIADDLRASGVEIVSTVSLDEAPDEAIVAFGSGKVEGLRAREQKYSCDVIVVCGPLLPDAGLFSQADGKLTVTAVGDAAGKVHAQEPCAARSGKRSFVCLCTDVTSKDLCDGIAEGFDHIETLKRYTTTTMGPCQGRMCQFAAVGICARETKRTVEETGLTTSRPPNPSVTLGALAGARHHPIRRTPMHYAHDEMGAVWMDMGDWKRPRYYRSGSGDERACVEAEYYAVRERAGIIDVSTLGKLQVRGHDTGQLLDTVYTHRFSDLRPGRVRYALMCDESGIILDDGTISRLADDHYFITTTTGNLDFVHQWLEWYLIGSDWSVEITNVTAGYGAINVAGPKARDVLSKLTDCDLSRDAFPYMACRQAMVNGASCILLRIGFVGETGWEIHCPAESAEDLWRNLLEAGQEFGIQPFGVEAQRLLRLEKRHVIVGVDTDALTSPYEAGMGWAAKLEKADFVGKVALTRAADAAPTERLVGFVVQGGRVPEDGAAVVIDGKLGGRVTSSRYSPRIGSAIGLAWVPTEKAREGAAIQVRVTGGMATARVTMEAFYDPEGARLRE